MAKEIVADRRLYRTADGRAVEAGDPDSAVLLAVAGQAIPDADVDRYDLSVKGGKVVLPGGKMRSQPEDKMAPAPENKAVEPDEELDQEPDAEFPRHVGGGWYELPDGERVQGREAAEAAMAGD